MLSTDLRSLHQFLGHFLSPDHRPEIKAMILTHLISCIDQAAAMEGHYPQPDLPPNVVDMALARRERSRPPVGAP